MADSTIAQQVGEQAIKGATEGAKGGTGCELTFDKIMGQSAGGGSKSPTTIGDSGPGDSGISSNKDYQRMIKDSAEKMAEESIPLGRGGGGHKGGRGGGGAHKGGEGGYHKSGSDLSHKADDPNQKAGNDQMSMQNSEAHIKNASKHAGESKDKAELKDRSEVLKGLEDLSKSPHLNQKDFTDKLLNFAKESEKQWNGMKGKDADRRDKDTFETYSRFTSLIDKVTDQKQLNRLAKDLPWVLRPAE